MNTRWTSPDADKVISNLAHFRDSREASESANDIISYYIRWFADPILGDAPRSVIDVGTGYGWASIAIALRSPSPTLPRIVAIDSNEARLAAAKQIADIVGVSSRIEWCVASLGSLPFVDRGFDTVISIEVIEHIDKSVAMIADLARIASKNLLVTTPNQLFPMINHDTALPFCHWLPNRARDSYARLFGRESLQDGNRFWSPLELRRALPEFKRSSEFLHFRNRDDYLSANEQIPVHMRTVGLQQGWYRIASCLGRASSYLLPTCAMMLKRQAP